MSAEIKDTDVNPLTGRDRKGKFTKGNAFGKGKKTPRALTRIAREMAGDNKLAEEAIKQLTAIVKNKDGKATPTEILRATDQILKFFTISASQDEQNKHEDEQMKSISDMFADLKGMQKE
ncbi:hypothetical protein PYR66_09945 [Klebsiella aerogenes]|nr:hypothetical protein PYR66_09945 [Klebsiella aerogenes]